MSARIRLLCSVALPVFFAAPVMAADLPVKAPLIASSSPAPAVHDWSGFYAGVNAGANWAHSGDPSTAAQCTGASGFALGSYFACADTPAINSVGTGSISGRGFTGGVQAGYNWQFHSLVVGVEADYDAFQVKASRTGIGNYASIPNQFSVTSSIEATALLTARARLGWAFGNFLAYATGGSAATHLRATNSFTDDTTPGFNGGGAGGWNASAKKLGWTVGGGAEYALNQNWSVRAEYLYVHFSAITASGVVSDTAAAYGSAISTSTDLSAHIARAGINYKF